MTLKTKFRLMITVSAAGLLAVAGFWIQGQHSSLLSERRQKTKNLVEVPYSIIEQQHQLESEGKISLIEAQRRAIEVIRAMRYEDSNYFWINDEHPTMIMHPLKPALDGTDLTSLKDPKNVPHRGKYVERRAVAFPRNALGAYLSAAFSRCSSPATSSRRPFGR